MSTPFNVKTAGGKPGMSDLINTFRKELREFGVTEDQLHSIFVSTPSDACSFTFSI
jgi:hypothetical protein